MTHNRETGLSVALDVNGKSDIGYSFRIFEKEMSLLREHAFAGNGVDDSEGELQCGGFGKNDR